MTTSRDERIIANHMATLGHRGGTARAQSLSRARRVEIATLASRAAAVKRSAAKVERLKQKA